MTKFTRSTVIMFLAVCAGGTRTAAETPPKVDARPALPLPPGIQVQSICGLVNDMQDVETYDGTLGVSQPYVQQHEPSTVQLQWLGNQAIASRLPGHSPGNVGGARWCSGTLISDRYVLTAGHCFDTQEGADGWVSPFGFDSNGKPVYARPAVLATLQVVNFRYQVNGATGAVRKPEVFPIVRLAEHREGGLDYAIVELGPDPQGRLPSATFTAATALTRTPVDQELIAVLQHPQGEPKKVEAGHVWMVSGTKLYYDDIDSMSGSSGSAVRDGDGRVIGVHTNGGCTEHSGANLGVPTAAIAAVSQIL